MVHHHNWELFRVAAKKADDYKLGTIFLDASQPGAGDYLRAVPSCPATTITSADFRLRLLRQLRLPIRPRSDEDPYGDTLLCGFGMTHRHTEVLNVTEQVAIRAHSASDVYRETPDHHDICPGYDPDLLIMGAVHCGEAVVKVEEYFGQHDSA